MLFDQIADCDQLQETETRRGGDGDGQASLPRAQLPSAQGRQHPQIRLLCQRRSTPCFQPTQVPKTVEGTRKLEAEPTKA